MYANGQVPRTSESTFKFWDESETVSEGGLSVYIIACLFVNESDTYKKLVSLRQF